MTEDEEGTRATTRATRRPSTGVAVAIWLAVALGLFGAAAVFGLGGLNDAVGEIPGTGLVGGLFVGMGLFAIPYFVARALGREPPVTPAFPRATQVLVYIGLVGLALIGVIAGLVDIGFLNIVVRDAG